MGGGDSEVFPAPAAALALASASSCRELHVAACRLHASSCGGGPGWAGGGAVRSSEMLTTACGGGGACGDTGPAACELCICHSSGWEEGAGAEASGGSAGGTTCRSSRWGGPGPSSASRLGVRRGGASSGRCVASSAARLRHPSLPSSLGGSWSGGMSSSSELADPSQRQGVAGSHGQGGRGSSVGGESGERAGGPRSILTQPLSHSSREERPEPSWALSSCCNLCESQTAD